MFDSICVAQNSKNHHLNTIRIQVVAVTNKLIPDDSGLPTLYATEDDAEPIARVKLFFPAGHYTAFLTEYDPKSKIAFGWAEQLPGGGELDYLNIDELQ